VALAQNAEFSLQHVAAAAAGRQETGLPDELGGEACRGPLLQPPVAHQADLVGKRERVLVVVRHHERRGAE